ncbi:MAG: hypothetical protein KGL39_06605 [Patescibacteria group bacterium]|nr:hypothetical protein [Patescibacteria group bacterium]
MSAYDLTPVMGIVDQGNPQPYSAATYQQFRLSAFRHQLVDQVMPKYGELIRMGKVFHVSGGVVGNGVGSVQDMPTTAAGFALYNGNTVQSNVHVVPLKVSLYGTGATGTMGLGTAAIAGVSTSPQSSPVAKATGVVGPNNAYATSSNVSNAVLGSTITLAGAPAWVVLGGRDTPAAIEIGAGFLFDIDGLFLVPPKYCLGMHVLAPAGSNPAAFLFTVLFAEYQIIAQ